MNVFEIPFSSKVQIFIASKPGSSTELEYDISNLTKLGENVVLCSLLTNNEAREFNLEEEQQVCEKHNIEFLHLEILDESIPGYQEFLELVNLLVKKIRISNIVIIHCKHGIGRSGMIAVAILLNFGYSLDKACNFLSKVRGYKVPQSISQFKLLAYYCENKG